MTYTPVLICNCDSKEEGLVKRLFRCDIAGKFREKRGLTYRELALRVGCTEHTAINWCKGNTVPSANQLAALSDVLEVDMNELFRRTKGG